ncbi:M3 family oligoendopeptidase [Virgibacillus sp. C22-A2]|uniref:M3 family oligoendopeptidase n=1 Tax=Virgibacillus tibetensis TaxID=3042313 RepID=A0ABU6KEC4_9BACI|nr:M3 family oligoendopeptidase [Virgibacillus sp. C22-A2]
MKKEKYQEVWNLKSLFAGGSESPELLVHIEQMEANLSELDNKLNVTNTPKEITDSLMIAELIEYITRIQLEVAQTNSFITCLLAQNPNDHKATILQGKITSISARFESAIQRTQKLLLNINDTLWEGMLDTDVLHNFKFILTEWRFKADNQLSEKEDRMVSDLKIDGYHSWGQFYKTLIGGIQINVPVNGQICKLSVGQAINLRSDPDEMVRKKAHMALEAKWKEKEELFAKILNHIAGFRLQIYKKQGVQNVLEEPLFNNRMKEETLNAMWRTVSKHKQPFKNYLNQKANILGDEKMRSYNFWAPISTDTQKISYQTAVDFILEKFSQFGPSLEKFTRKAFVEGWVESEDRPNKSAVGFCAGFPLSGESRVFMTYGGTITNILTLAHELGHAFHNCAMESVDGISKQYPLNMAETASIFSEMIVLDAAMEKAESMEEHLFLLDEKLKRSVMNFMNLHSRFLFELKFYEERKEGFVSSSRLNELMQEAVEESYEGSFENASVRSWIWTPHFYITKSPFYNFPYTFGYLFSLSIYAKAKEKGIAFEKDYLNLLRDSGRMSIEDLVMKHLGEDITLETFWDKGMKLCVKDAEEFINLTSDHVTKPMI